MQTGPLNRVRAGADRWVRLVGWLRWSAHPSRCCLQDSRMPLLFLLAPPSGSWVLAFLYLVLICPSWACMHLVLVACSFFVFCYLKKRLSRYEHCSFKRSRVPACLNLGCKNSSQRKYLSKAKTITGTAFPYSTDCDIF